jgi:hypothetical protein
LAIVDTLPSTPQELMDAAFDNYFALSDMLMDDLNALLESESNSQHWRRNFIRVSASLIEGYGYCLREMCAVSFVCVAPEISQKEEKVLRSEQALEANERIKRTLRVAYKLFELQPAPNFGGSEWPRAKRVLQKRHLLMHPKSTDDLDISDDLWKELREDATWMIKQFFDFISAMQQKYSQ